MQLASEVVPLLAGPEDFAGVRVVPQPESSTAFLAEECEPGLVITRWDLKATHGESGMSALQFGLDLRQPKSRARSMHPRHLGIESGIDPVLEDHHGSGHTEDHAQQRRDAAGPQMQREQQLSHHAIRLETT